MINKNRMKPAVSNKLRRGQASLAASFTQKISFGSPMTALSILDLVRAPAEAGRVVAAIKAAT